MIWIGSSGVVTGTFDEYLTEHVGQEVSIVTTSGDYHAGILHAVTDGWWALRSGVRGRPVRVQTHEIASLSVPPSEKP